MLSQVNCLLSRPAFLFALAVYLLLCFELAVAATDRLSKIYALTPAYRETRYRPDDLETQIEAIRQRSSQNARACALIAQCAHRLQLNALAEQAYRSALACVTDMAIRTMVAQYAELYGDWKTVSDLFDHRVPEDIPIASLVLFISSDFWMSPLYVEISHQSPAQLLTP